MVADYSHLFLCSVCLDYIIKGWHWCIKWISQHYGFSTAYYVCGRVWRTLACCCSCSCWRKGLGCMESWPLLRGRRGEAGGGVENESKGCEAFMQQKQQTLASPFFSCLPPSSSRTQKIDLFDFQSQLYLLLSFRCSRCSSRWPFPTPSPFFLGSVNYFSNYGWRKDSSEA